MEERFRPLTFHGLILRSQLVTLLVRGVCYSESQSVSATGSWKDSEPAVPSQAAGRSGWANSIPRVGMQRGHSHLHFEAAAD